MHPSGKKKNSPFWSQMCLENSLPVKRIGLMRYIQKLKLVLYVTEYCLLKYYFECKSVVLMLVFRYPPVYAVCF